MIYTLIVTYRLSTTFAVENDFVKNVVKPFWYHSIYIVHPEMLVISDLSCFVVFDICLFYTYTVHSRECTV